MFSCFLKSEIFPLIQNEEPQLACGFTFFAIITNLIYNVNLGLCS